jgi:hypothetical protein
LLKSLSNRDLQRFDEKYIKLVLLSYLKLTNVYQFISEGEVENGYTDIFLGKGRGTSQAKYEWLIELKYVKESERNQLEQIRQEAVTQLQGYMASREMVGRPNRKAAALLFVGKGEILLEYLP